MSDNPIKVAREKIGWPLSRLAATACIGIDELMALEAAPVDWNDKTAALIRSALELRGARFDGEGGVTGPNDADVIVGLAASLTSDDLASLEALAYAPAGGAPCRAIREFASLRSENLIQFGAVKRLIVFDNEDVHENTADQRVRLSARGKLLCSYLEKRRALLAAERKASKR